MEASGIEELGKLTGGPAFAVQDGVIRIANPEAQTLGLQTGKTLADVLPQLRLPQPDEAPAETVILLDQRVWSLRFLAEGEAWNCFLRPQPLEIPAPNESTLLHTAGSIRNALQDIHVALDALAERITPGDPLVSRQAALALRSVYRLRRTAGELELFSRLRMGSYQLRTENCPVAAKTAIFCGETRELLRSGGFELSWSLPKQDVSFCLDWPLTAALLRELLANAAANSADGKLRLELTRADRNRLRFAVMNRQAEELPATLFHRHAQPDTLLEGGLGLGLSTVSAGAAAHGGGLMLSRAGDGTVTALLSITAGKSAGSGVRNLVQLPDSTDAALEAFSGILPPEVFRPEDLL